MAKKNPIPVYSVRPEEGSFTIYRDAEALQTPRNLSVSVPIQKLADAIQNECASQGERLDLRQMPMTQMTLTVLDITTRQRDEIIKGIMRYGDTELICVRATEPPDLVVEQDTVWQPYLSWAQQRFEAHLAIGTGVVPFAQRPEALEAIRAYVETCDAYALTGVSEAVGISGSLVLGLALATGHADAASVFEASELDTLWQAKKWGADPATVGRQAGIRNDLDDCARWFSLLT